MRPADALRLIKAVHTLAWAFFAGCIIAVPLAAWSRRYDLAVTYAGIVCVEVLVLVFNAWRCPLTGVAARYTSERRDNFDIYLPEWLARHNKGIFGTLFALGLVFTLVRWLGWLG